MTLEDWVGLVAMAAIAVAGVVVLLLMSGAVNGGASSAVRVLGL